MESTADGGKRSTRVRKLSPKALEALEQASLAEEAKHAIMLPKKSSKKRTVKEKSTKEEDDGMKSKKKKTSQKASEDKENVEPKVNKKLEKAKEEEPVLSPIVPLAPGVAKTMKKTDVDALLKDIYDRCLKYTNVKLIGCLTAHNQVYSKLNKSGLAERISEVFVYGGLPYCPLCTGGRLKKDGDEGKYYCPGFYDDDEYIICDYKTKKPKRFQVTNELGI